MTTTNNSVLNLIETARTTRQAIKDLEEQLQQLNIPTLSDTTEFPLIYAQIQSQMSGEELREQRLCFVFIVAYLYSPASIFGSYPLKAGLRSHIGSIIHRCNAEISEMLSEAKFRYERLNSFREKIDKILVLYLDNR